ncbi:MAG TPA: hypothetical protein VLX91_07265 [Candidatus Acidoferrales bacterium]|nr:hypothetical protein [Candidatus Acidoferrales bacterium]
MKTLKTCFLIIALMSTDSRSHNRIVSVTLIPLVGDTLDGNQRKFFGLFEDIESFQWAVFSIDQDSNVTAKICFLENGIYEFNESHMGPLVSLRDRLGGILISKNKKPREGFLYSAFGIAKIPQIGDSYPSGRSFSVRYELGCNIGIWAAAALAIDGYDPTHYATISFVIAIHSPRDFHGLTPYVYYNPRPFGEGFRAAKYFSQAAGVGLRLTLVKHLLTLRAGGTLLFTTADVLTNSFPYWEYGTKRKVLFIAEMSLELLHFGID